MDRLPRVLQTEIWEYVRGDRAYWKAQHQQTVDHLGGIQQEALMHIACPAHYLKCCRESARTADFAEDGRSARYFRNWLRSRDLPIFPMTEDPDRATVTREWFSWVQSR
jgi:hypothetical protein